MKIDDMLDVLAADRHERMIRSGVMLGQDRINTEKEAKDMGIVETVGRAVSTGNSLAAGYQWLDRQMTYPADPQFDYDAAKAQMFAGVPSALHYKFNSVQSLAEGLALRNDILNDLQDQKLLSHAGFKGFAAQALAGIVDADLPLMLLPGGSYIGPKLAATVGGKGRIASVLHTAGAGFEAGVITETGRTLVAPTGTWEDIPAAGLSGIIFGGALGGMSKLDTDTNASMTRARNEFAARSTEGSVGIHDFKSPVMTTDTVFNMEGSVGAAQPKGSQAGIRSPDDPDFDPELVQDRVVKMRDDARQFLEDNDVDFQKEVAFPDTKVGRAAKRFYEFIQKTPLATDADILLNSKSPIAQALAYKLLENPVGIARNNRSGAMLNNIYFAQVAAPVNTNYGKYFDLWIKEQGVGEPGPLQHFNTELRNRFDQEVMTELQYRYHDGQSNPDVSPAVKEMVDRIDESSAKALKILQGEVDELSVKGSEDLTPESGWFRQLWRGDKIAEIIQNAPKGQRKKIRMAIEKALVASYRRVYPGLDKDLATKYAKAVLRRASARERGIDTNLGRMLAEEGRDFLEEALVDNGFSKADAAKFVDGIKGVNADKNKEGILKRRKDVDLRTKIEGTEYRLMDLVDSDIVSVWTKYSRKVAGSAAMARHGIQKADKRDIINAILADQKAAGGNTISKDTLEAVFSYFDGGAFAGGINPWMRRTLQTTNLSLLNGLGLTQLAETGVQVAAVGWEAFAKTAKKEVRDMLDGKNTPAMEELKGWAAFIDGEHNVFMDHLMLDEMRTDPGIAAELGNWLDGMLIKGRHLQGYVSGFYKVKQLQQRIAVRSMLYRLAEHFQGGRELGYARLRDLGLDGEVEHRIGNYFAQGIVEMSPDGDVLKLNFDKWNQRDVMDFAAVLNRHTDQVVQRAARGETSAWMHKDVGSLLMHLKSFTLLAMQKQLLRNARIMDAETTMGFIYSMLTAGTVYTAQQALSGRSENLTPEKIMKGSVMLSNMTGWIPQWSDPMMSMLGMDDLRFSHYGARGVGGDVVSVPPALPTINRITHIPEATRDVLSGDYSNEDIYALQATPIIGNLYGFSYMFNEMKK